MAQLTYSHFNIIFLSGLAVRGTPLEGKIHLFTEHEFFKPSLLSKKQKINKILKLG